MMARRLEHLPRAVAESKGYEVLPGVKELLPQLRDAGYLLGLTTGGVEEAARMKLERGGLNEYFAFGGYGSDSPDRIELTKVAVERAETIRGRDLERDEVLDIGDTPLDITAAHAANTLAVGVATGHYSKEQLKEAGADHVLGTLEEDLPL